ncbi:peptidoglycan-binding domain-containing protein [Sorangium sp. So ce1000]|uniref:peptidoglycan-binding domain-containing protein n=1 Tax=Sorangium sp. So ce1000 TaxID=3133325 RepID=UPI003F5E7C00
MTARIISAGSDERRALVLLFFVPPIHRPGDPHLDDQIRAALPGACVIAYSDQDGEPIALAEARARAVGWTGGPLVLGGFSAGVLRGVRKRLLEGAKPDAVIAIDGTHADLPPAAWQLDVWRPIIADARDGRRLFVATATQQLYVESLPGEARYMATITLLRRLTGWPLASPGPLPLGEHVSDGDCHVHSYASAKMDGRAHSDQQTRVLPEMLRRHLAPWLARGADPAPAPAEDRVTPEPPTPEAPTVLAPCVLRLGAKGDDVGDWQRRLIELGYDPGAPDHDFGRLTDAATREFQRDARLTVDGVVGPRTRAAAEDAAPKTIPPAPPAGLAAAFLACARADLAAGVRETAPNYSERIQKMLDAVGVTWPDEWCAAAVTFWLRAAAQELHVEPPVRGSAGALALKAQFERAERFVSAEELRRNPALLQPGMVGFETRGDPGSGKGHTYAIASAATAMRFTSIDANGGSLGDRVAETQRDLRHPRFLGAGRVG